MERREMGETDMSGGPYSYDRIRAGMRAQKQRIRRQRLVTIAHPEAPLADPAVVTEDSYYEVWEEQGWTLVSVLPDPAPWEPIR
jgi:hypothetical protein